MADNTPVGEVVAEAIQETSEGKDPKDLSLEALLLLLMTERLHKLENDSKKELLELKKRQEKVSYLHKLSKSINTATNPKGELDLKANEELREFLKEAKEMGVDYDAEKNKYNKDERDRLMENIRMTIDDLNVQNDMQLQTITRLTNERYESYQMARSILKPLHDAKTRMAQNITLR